MLHAPHGKKRGVDDSYVGGGGRGGTGCEGGRARNCSGMGVQGGAGGCMFLCFSVVFLLLLRCRFFGVVWSDFGEMLGILFDDIFAAFYSIIIISLILFFLGG